MGLFSFFSKNKQDRAAEDSGRFYSKDDDAALGERARSKRASHAGAGAGGATPGRRTAADPMLPEKKRARRRLVGAIALALAAAVGLPMLLDSSPKPTAGDIAIQIPSKDKAAPLPVPNTPGTPGALGSQAAPPSGEKSVAAEDSLNPGEEIVPVPPKASAPAAATPAAAAEPKAEHKPDTPKPEHKEAKLEHKDTAKEARAEQHRLEKEKADKERADREKLAERAAEKAAKAEKAAAAAAKAKSEDKPVKPVHDEARALAILEGKPAEKHAEPARAESAGQKFVVQVGAMSSQEKAAELQARLREAGIASYTQKSGELIKVKVGPFSREEAEKVRAKLGRIGQSGFITPA